MTSSHEVNPIDQNTWPNSMRLVGAGSITIEVQTGDVGWSKNGFYCSAWVAKDLGSGQKRNSTYWNDGDLENRPNEIRVTSSSTDIHEALSVLRENLAVWLEVDQDQLLFTRNSNNERE